MAELWPLFNSVEAESVVNALRRWQSAFSSHQTRKAAPTIIDPYVRLVLDRVLPADVETRLCREPLDRLMQEVIAVRTAVIDETLLEWTASGITQVVILASGFDTRSWRLRWPTGINVYEVDSAMIQAQKMIALGDIQPNCASRLALIGDVFSLAKVFKSLKSVGFDSGKPAIFLVEDVVEYMLPERASEMFAYIANGCAPGSQMVVTLSDCKLRELLKRYGRTVHLIEEYEPPGIVFNRILNAGWKDDGMILSGSLETRFDVDLHGCLYIAKLSDFQAGPDINASPIEIGVNIDGSGHASSEEANALRQELQSSRQMANFNKRATKQMLEKNLRFQQEIEDLKKQLEIEANAAREARKRLRLFKKQHGIAEEAADTSPPPPSLLARRSFMDQGDQIELAPPFSPHPPTHYSLPQRVEDGPSIPSARAASDHHLHEIERSSQRKREEDAVVAQRTGALLQELDTHRHDNARLRQALKSEEEERSQLAREVMGLREDATSLRAVNKELRAQVLEGERVRAVRGPEYESQMDAINAANKTLQVELGGIQRQIEDRREALEHEAASWRLAAEQAASVAEKAQHQHQLLERKLSEALNNEKAKALELEARQHELSLVKQRLDAAESLLRKKADYLEKVNDGVIKPLNQWYKDHVDPSVAAPMPASLPKSKGFAKLKAMAEKLLGPETAGSFDTGADKQVVMASAAFELLAERIEELRDLLSRESQLAVELGMQHIRNVEEIREGYEAKIHDLESKLRESSFMEHQLKLRIEAINEEMSRATRERHLAGDREETLRHRLTEREEAYRSQLAALEEQSRAQVQRLMEESRAFRVGSQEEIKAIREEGDRDRRRAREEGYHDGKREVEEEAGKHLGKIEAHVKLLEEKLVVAMREIHLAQERADQMAHMLGEAEARAARDMERAAAAMAAQSREAEEELREAGRIYDERSRKEKGWFEGKLAQEKEDGQEQLRQARYQAQLQIESVVSAAKEERLDAERRAVAEARRAMEVDRSEWEREVISRFNLRMDESSGQWRKQETLLQGTIDELQQTVTRLKSEALAVENSFKAQLQQAQHEVLRSQSRAASIEDRLEQQANAVRGHIDGVQNDAIRWKERTIEREKELELCRDKIAHLESRLNAVVGSSQSLSDRAEGVEREADALKNELRVRDHEVEELKAHKQELMATIRVLESKLNEIRQRFKTLEQQNERLSASSSLQAERIRSDLSIKVKSLEDQRDEIERHASALNDCLMLTRAEAEEASAQVRVLSSSLEEHRKMLMDAEVRERESNRSVMQSIRESEATAASLREVQEAGERRIEQLKAMHAEQVSMIEDQARQRMESTQSTYSNLMVAAQEKLHHLRMKQSSLVAQISLGGGESRQSSMQARPSLGVGAGDVARPSFATGSDLLDHVRNARDQNFSHTRGTIPLPMMPLPLPSSSNNQPSSVPRSF